jgi:cytochrome c
MRSSRGILLALTVLSLALLTAVACVGDDPDEGARLAAPAEGDADVGREALRQYGCASCHVIPGVTGANNHVGPPLTSFARREYIAGTLINTPDNLRLWLQEPDAIRPGTAMPATGVTDEDAWHIIAYLATLD